MLHQKRFIALLLIAVIWFSCSQRNSPNKTTFDSLGVIEGKWVMQFDGSSVMEQWVKVNDTLYSGKSYEITGSDTVVTETISLVCNESGIYYIPAVMDQNDGLPVSFRLTGSEQEKFVFENPEHDFPTAITYEFLPGNALKASVSGMIQGELRSLDFDYVRAD